MNVSRARANAPEGIGLKWIALAAAAGALGMWFVLTRGAHGDAEATAQSAPAVRAEPAHLQPAPEPAAPWSVPPPAVPTPNRTAPPARVPTVRREDTALPSPELGPPIGDPADYLLDDATLARRARADFGIDCPAVADRGARRSGKLDVTCSNGTRLRVYLMGDGPPRIAVLE